MDFQKPLCIFLFLLTLLSISHALKFNVGGSRGWVPNPSESYNNWAGRNRFQINDTLVFKYKKNSDSVLEVKKEDYDKCNKTNPIKKFENGDTEFKFDRSGPFYFISGKDGNCEKGQKLIVVVLSPRTPKTSPSPSSPPTKSPPSPSPASSPSSPPISPSHPPTSQSPAGTPATSPAPSTSPPVSSPSPSTSPPVSSPSPSTSTPVSSPTPVTSPPESPPFTSPPSPGPETATPTSSPGPSSSQAPPGGPTSPPSASNATAPAPAKSNGISVAPSNLIVFYVTIVVGGALLRYY